MQGVVGGGDRSRTGDGGFADLCLTTWLRRPGGASLRDAKGRRQSTSPLSSASPRGGLERVKGLEPSTFCMASRRSSQLSYTRSRRGCTRTASEGRNRAGGRGRQCPARSSASLTRRSASAFCSRRMCLHVDLAEAVQAARRLGVQGLEVGVLDLVLAGELPDDELAVHEHGRGAATPRSSASSSPASSASYSATLLVASPITSLSSSTSVALGGRGGARRSRQGRDCRARRRRCRGGGACRLGSPADGFACRLLRARRGGLARAGCPPTGRGAAQAAAAAPARRREASPRRDRRGAPRRARRRAERVGERVAPARQRRVLGDVVRHVDEAEAEVVRRARASWYLTSPVTRMSARPRRRRSARRPSRARRRPCAPRARARRLKRTAGRPSSAATSRRTASGPAARASAPTRPSPRLATSFSTW